MRDTALPPPVSLRRGAPGLEGAYTLLDWAQSCPAPPCGPPRLALLFGSPEGPCIRPFSGLLFLCGAAFSYFSSG